MTNMVSIMTGAAGGLGKETALAFHDNDYRVAINYLESEKAARELVGRLGDNALAVRADMSIAGQVEDMAEIIISTWGRVDVLVNNAGIAIDSLLISHKEEDWNRVINVNLKSVFLAVKTFAPLMKEGGHIINISSYSGLKGKKGQSAYSASKAALLGLTRTSAIELAGYGIRVNAVLPGYMPTTMGMGAEKALRQARAESLLKTLSDPKEVARFIAYLAGTNNVTGQVFCLDSRIV